MAKKWNINAILSHDNSTFDYKFDITYNGQTHTLFSGDTFKKRLLYTYTSWCLFSPGYYDPVTDSYINTVNDINDAITMMHYLFTEWVQNREHAFTKMYAALVAEYNPLWNVDGVEGLITKTTHTGTNTNAKSGTDTVAGSGTDTVAGSGTDTVASSGTDTDTLSGIDTFDHDVTKDETTRTGNETNADTGTDTTRRSVATFDSNDDAVPYNAEGVTHGKTTTTTYNNVKDARTVDAQDKTTYGKVDTVAYGKTDTTTYGKTDTTTYGKTDTTTYNSSNTETRNLIDEYLELKIRQGNIGLTKSTELVESEMRLRKDWDNLINEWIKDFIESYCIL